MASTGELRDGVVRDAVVRSLADAVERPCARPSCRQTATATLTFRYGTREAWLERLGERADPQSYDLCSDHAARTHPPRGWQLRDRRPDDQRRPVVPPATPVDLGGDRTVAVLAAALRSVADPVSEDAIVDDTGVDRDVASLLALDASPQLELVPPSAPDLMADAGPTLLDAEDDPSAAGMVADDRAPRPPLVVRDRDARAGDDTGAPAAEW